LKNRRLRFTATAQEHVRREKAWWWANRDHTDVFTEEVEQALRIVAALPGAERPTLNRLFQAFVVYTSGESAPTSITHSMNTK